MKRLLVLLAALTLLGCDVEWSPDFQQPTVACAFPVQFVPISVGNAWESAWNDEEHDLVIQSLRRRQGGGAWTSLVSTPIFVDVPDDPTGDPEAEGINWSTYIDSFAYGSTATWTYELVWAWTDTGTTTPTYQQRSTSQNFTLPGCP